MQDRQFPRDADKNITQRECDRCYSGIRDWISTIDKRITTIDKRMWMVLVMGFFQLCGLVVLLVEKILSR